MQAKAGARVTAVSQAPPTIMGLEPKTVMMVTTIMMIWCWVMMMRYYDHLTRAIITDGDMTAAMADDIDGKHR